MNRIKELRKELGMTQTDLGNRLEVVKQTISAYERGLNEPSLDILQQLSFIFGVSVDYIIGRSDERGVAVTPTESDILTDDERQILWLFRQATNKRQFIRMAEKFLQLNEDGKDIILGKIVEVGMKTTKPTLAPTGTEGALGK